MRLLVRSDSKESRITSWPPEATTGMSPLMVSLTLPPAEETRLLTSPNVTLLPRSPSCEMAARALAAVARCVLQLDLKFVAGGQAGGDGDLHRTAGWEWSLG